MIDPCLQQRQLPPIPDGCGIIPSAEKRIPCGPHSELMNVLHEGFVPLSDETGPAPVLNDALEQIYRRVLARALALAACALLFAAVVDASLIHSPLHQSFFSAHLLFRGVFVLQFLFMGLCSRYVQNLAIAPAAVLLFAYAVFCALEFSVLLPPATLAAAFLCAALMYGVTALWGLLRGNDLALPITPIFMILAGSLILVAVNSLLRSPSSAWTLSSLAVVIFAGLTGYYGQQIRDFYQEYDDDDAEGWKASVLGALLLLVNSVNFYPLVMNLLIRDDHDCTDDLSH